MSRRRYLVAYDIREPKRLQRVHSAMKEFGYPLQYSVFVCDLDVGEKLRLRLVLGDLIHQGQDSVALVDLGETRARSTRRFEFMGVAPTLPQHGAHII